MECLKNTLNKFIEATAVMLITSCVIPILVVVFYVWLLKVFMGAGSGNVFDSSKEWWGEKRKVMKGVWDKNGNLDGD